MKTLENGRAQSTTVSTKNQELALYGNEMAEIDHLG